MHTPINPESHPPARGFSYAFASTGDLIVHLAGHTAFDDDGVIHSVGDIETQFQQALGNLGVTAEAAGVELSQIVKLTLFVTDVRAYKAHSKEIGTIYREFFGDHYPAITLVGVTRLWDRRAMIEIEGVAIAEQGSS